jgi:hypothetical protein
MAAFANFTPVGRRHACLGSLLIALLLPAGLAHASAYSDVLRAYENQGTIPSCQFSSRVLNSALANVDTYGAQYFADFTAAIQSALDNRAAGACSPAQLALTGAGARASALPRASLPAVGASTGADLPAPLVLLAIFGGLAAVAGSALALARARGWDPAPAAAWRHAWHEAGYRVGGTWAEFVDWLRSA